MGVTFLFPPSLGQLKAQVRGELVERELERRLQMDVRVDVAPSYEVLETRVLASDTDVAWAPPALCAQASHVARAILKAVRNGGAEYGAALICRYNDALSETSLHQKRAAWVDRRSTGGYLLAARHMRQLGHDPDAVLASQSFAGSYRDALMAVVSNLADFTSIFAHDRTNAGVRASLVDLIGGLADRLAPFAFTDTSPADGLIVTHRLPEQVAQKVVSVLVDPPTGAQGSVLLSVCDASGFLRATAGDYAGLL